MRNILSREEMEIPCVAANNDFTSPIPEHRECQLLMVKEITRLAADLGAKCVRLFAAWHGIVMRDGFATYDLVRGDYYNLERQYPFVTRHERWNFVKDCLKEVAGFGEEFGVVMTLQNHAPLIRHWKDCVDLVNEVGSPWLKFCLDLPNLHNFDHDWVSQAVETVGKNQVHTHFGGEYYRDSDGNVKPKQLKFGKPLPDYGHFIRKLSETGYDGFISFELCHPVLSDTHERQGLDYVDLQAQLAYEYMNNLIKENGK
jgi:sugar phosphate isomerase/epimerase